MGNMDKMVSGQNAQAINIQNYHLVWVKCLLVKGFKGNSRNMF